MKKQLLQTDSLRKLVIYGIITVLCGFSFEAFGQNIPIKGVVKDADGQSIPGVSVSVQNTTTSVITNMDGNYSISAPPDAILVFSSMGFKTQLIPVKKRLTIDVTLAEDVEMLDEAVVVGYGTVRKSHLTGSVAKIKNEQLDQIPVARVDDALNGQIAGVQIQQTNPAAGEAPVIRVRGQGSISFDSNPLIVVDGIVVGNDADYMTSLDMNDVESVEVLKDASSGAIYGSRGANGIIMITTKKGVEGPTKFTYHGYVGFKQVPKNDYLTTPSAWADFVRANNGGELTDRMEYIERLGTYTDWQDVMMDGGMITSHAISARGGTKNTKFNTSLSYLNDQGVLLTDNFQKLNFRINMTTRLRKWLRFGINLNPSHTEQKRFPIGVHDAIRQSPWLPTYIDENNIDYVNRYRENGRWEDVMIGDYAMERMFDDYDLDADMPDPNLSGTDISTTSNQGSLAKVLERDRRKKQTKVYAKTFFDVDFNKDLRFRQTLGVDYRYTLNTTWVGTKATRNGALDSESNRGTQNRWHYISESTLNWSKQFGGHGINAVGGFAYEGWQVEESYMEAVGFTNDLIRTLPAANLSGGSTYQAEERLVSYLARVAYNYKSRYLLSASIRTDGSSKFGPDKKYGWFPAVSGGWVLSKESFWNQDGVVTSLKLRASYGVTGNNNGIGYYDHIGLLAPVNTGFSQIGYNPLNIENPNLGWEKLNEFNPGIDAQLYGGRINMSFDYYNRTSEDLLLNVPIPSVTGFETALVNKGVVKNEGVEFEVITKNIVNRNFTWSSGLILTHNRNTLVDFAGASGLISIVDDKRPAEWIAIEGNPISSFYGYVVEKEIPLEYINDPFYPINAQSQDIYVRDLNGDGVIDTDDRTVLGSPYPDLVWSFTNNFKYKDFDLSFMFQGSHGAEVRNISSQYIKNEFSSKQDYNAEFPDPHLVKERIFTSDDVQDASYVALRTLNLGYSFPVGKISGAGIQRLRLYFAGQNLLYFMASNYEGYNPEGIDQGLGNPLTYGYQRGPAPIYRTYSFGLNLDF